MDCAALERANPRGVYEYTLSGFASEAQASRLFQQTSLFANALQLEDVFNRMVEVLREEQGQGKGRDIIAFFHGTNRLTADADGFCQVLLGNFLFLPQTAQAVIDCVFACHMLCDSDKGIIRRKNRQGGLTGCRVWGVGCSGKYPQIASFIIFPTPPYTLHPTP
jgi:hypothetical protein